MLPRVRNLALALLIVVAATLVGCGSTHTITTTTTVTTTTTPAGVSVPCPAGKSFMGCSVAPSKPRLTISPAPKGPKFPDVSDWQGHPNWGTAKPHIAGAVAKLGEGSSIIDSSAAYNVAAFKRLKIPYAVYWFVRPTGCSSEGNEIKHAAQSVGGVGRIVLDEEVGGISGYARCLNPYVHSVTGRDALVYRSSGNNFDGSDAALRCWVAAYGPGSAPACSGRVRVAWQFTDGQYGFPTSIPGVGRGDVSVDYGLLPKLSKPKPKVNPHHYNWLPNAKRTFGKGNYARERNTVETWDKRHCEEPARRKVCRSTRSHLSLLEQRLSVIANHTGKHLKRKLKKPRWTALHYRAGHHKTTLGGAYQQLARRLDSKHHGVVKAW